MVGFPTTAGWRLLHAASGGVDLMPATDSPVVARMRAAGTVMLGKTNVPVLSHTGSHANDSWAGPTYNAAGRDFLPGGSSAGTATAVAASLAVLGLAEETGGSIQNPASAQGLVGIKPTFALVPNAGVMPLSANRDVVGPIARCVRDAALCLDVLAGYTAEDPKTVAGVGHRPKGGYASKLAPDALAGKRIGLYGPGWRDQPLSEETDGALQPRPGPSSRPAAPCWSRIPSRARASPPCGQPTLPGHEFDARGLESVPYDLEQYLEAPRARRGAQELRRFRQSHRRREPFAAGRRARLHAATCRSSPPAWPTRRARPTCRNSSRRARPICRSSTRSSPARRSTPWCSRRCASALAPLHGTDTIHETTVSEINIAGLPGVTVPAGTLCVGRALLPDRRRPALERGGPPRLCLCLRAGDPSPSCAGSVCLTVFDPTSAAPLCLPEDGHVLGGAWGWISTCALWRGSMPSGHDGPVVEGDHSKRGGGGGPGAAETIDPLNLPPPAPASP